MGVQDFLRKRAHYLKRAYELGRGGIVPRFKKATHNAVERLNEPALKAASRILGRRYASAALIKHRLFGFWGFSIFIESECGTYSEAFAGSGESAVLLLVHEVLSAQEKSLLLLDEPETSLHPGAQIELQKFLLEQCLHKKHQTVLCTHAPNLVAGLPPDAIKVFRSNVDGKFFVTENVRPTEAFFYLGQIPANKITILAEDKLCSAIMIRALAEFGVAFASAFEVKVPPGGAKSLFQEAVIHSRETESRIILFFDGDQKPDKEIFSPDELLIGIDSDPGKAVLFLRDKVKEATGSEIKVHTDGGREGGSKAQERDGLKKYLRFLRENCFFLPTKIAEELIWNDETAENLLKILDKQAASLTSDQIAATVEFKEKFRLLTSAIKGTDTSDDIGAVEEIFLTSLFSRKTRPEFLDWSRETLQKLIDRWN